MLTIPRPIWSPTSWPPNSTAANTSRVVKPSRNPSRTSCAARKTSDAVVAGTATGPAPGRQAHREPQGRRRLHAHGQHHRPVDRGEREERPEPQEDQEEGEELR